MRRLILSCAVLLTAVSASGQTTLIYDDFTSGSSSYSITGTTPDIDTFSGGQWVQNTGNVADSGIAQNGVLTVTSSGNNDNAIYFLQFSSTGLAANTTYTLTFQEGPVPVTSGNQQANVGFASGSSTAINRGNSYFGQVQGNRVTAFTPNGFNSHSGPTASTTAFTAMTLTFDTGTGLIDFYANGSTTPYESYQYGSATNGGPNSDPALSSIDYIYLDYYSNSTSTPSSANFGPITLTEAADAPEPSTMALLACSAMAALVFVWRRRQVGV